MKCYFREGVDCPVPEGKLTGDFCGACASWENVKVNKLIAEASQKMTAASVFTPDDKKASPDEHRDVA